MDKDFHVSPKMLYVIFSGLFIVVLAAATFFYFQYRTLQKTKTEASTVESTATAVSKLMEIPDEAPTLATVSDVGKLKDQDFFRRAQNGDKVLIFKNAKKAILYRPFTNKIIEVGPIKIDEPSTVAGAATDSAGVISPTVRASVVPSATATPSAAVVSVAIYNGTKITGLSKKTGDQLLAEFSDIKIKSTANAEGEYKKTVVVDLSKNQKAKASSIAKFLKGEVGSLPKDEAAPDGDILVILGSTTQ